MFAVYVYIPFQFYGLMKTMHKEIFFELRNKKRFNNIGIALLTVYLAELLVNYLHFHIHNSLFAFDDYTIIKEPTNVIWLILSMLSMIIAEMISRGVKIKEEQELTV
jgi:hypothetical protein